MFAQAVQIASQFTWPVVISSRTVKGDCHSVIGACVVVNREGWVLTTAHLFGLMQQQEEAARKYREYTGGIRDFEQATTSDALYRRRKLHQLHHPAPDMVRDCSVWWGVDGMTIKDVRIMPANDLALGRFEPFEPERISSYPVFKHPQAGYTPGRSLCRLGFSFYEIKPTYDEKSKAFILPPGSVPLPFFAMEGMLSRILLAPPPDASDNKAELGKFIETSTPGLQGQSGGPIFDADGTVWAIQSHTRHLPLGFKPNVPGKPKGQVEHQFLNVGVGIHAEPILQLLEQAGVEHQHSS